MEKLQFTAPPRAPRRKDRSAIVRVTSEAYNAIEEISARTGLSNSYVASRMIEFASKNAVIVCGESETEDDA